MEERAWGTKPAPSRTLEERPEDYRPLLRMASDEFTSILSLIESCIQNTFTHMPPGYPVKDKLQLTLLFLASGVYTYSLIWFWHLLILKLVQPYSSWYCDPFFGGKAALFEAPVSHKPQRQQRVLR